VGQRIKVDGTRVIDASLLISTDRSLTGTDGEGYDSSEAAASGSTFPAKLAVELFESDDAIVRVYVSQNVVVVTRADGWPDEASESAQRVVEEFFLFYPEA
jgi:hypothetical protein